jgi:GPI-anchor transamidase subunit T
VRELRLLFSKGSWDSENWGLSPDSGAPTGADLWALVPEQDAWQQWEGLTRALSGLYCSSLSTLDESRTYSPHLASQRLSAQHSANASEHTALRLLRGSLPREAVCTENLTPLVKLLPCRDKAGLGTLLHPTRILSAAYYSFTASASAVWSGSAAVSLKVTHTVTAVFNDAVSPLSAVPSQSDARHMTWSLASLLEAPTQQHISNRQQHVPACPLSDVASISAHVPAWANANSTASTVTRQLQPDAVSMADVWLNAALPHSQALATAETAAEQFDVRVQHFLSQRGGTNGVSTAHITCASSCDCAIEYLQPVPVFMAPLFSTLKLQLGDHNVPLGEADVHITVGQSGPAILELSMLVPAGETLVLGFEVSNSSTLYCNSTSYLYLAAVHVFCLCNPLMQSCMCSETLNSTIKHQSKFMMFTVVFATVYRH